MKATRTQRRFANAGLMARNFLARSDAGVLFDRSLGNRKKPKAILAPKALSLRRTHP